MKRCSVCGETKDCSEFHTKEIEKGTFNSRCKDCMKIYTKEYNLKTKERRQKSRSTPEFKKRASQYRIDMRNRRPHYYWAVGTITNHHNKRGCKVVASVRELETLAKNTTHCYYCGVELEWAAGKGLHPTKPSLDRINNEDEIRTDNVVIICHQCNRSKGERTHREFINYCKLIIEREGNDPCL